MYDGEALDKSVATDPITRAVAAEVAAGAARAATASRSRCKATNRRSCLMHARR